MVSEVASTSNPAPNPARAIWQSIAIYYAIACGASWAIWAPMILGQDGLKLLRLAPSVPVFISMGTLGPLLACYAAHRIMAGDWRAVRLLSLRRLDWVWLFLGPILVLVCFFIVFPLMISKGTPAWYEHISALRGIPLVMFSANLLGGPLFEEFGWRGFLQCRIQEVFPPWIAAVFVGILWAGWHLPLFFVAGWSSAPLVSYFLIETGLSVVMAFGFNASGKSVAVAVLMHSVFNASPRFLGAYLEGSSMRSYPSAEWFVAGAFLVTGLILVVMTRGYLAARPDA